MNESTISLSERRAKRDSGDEPVEERVEDMLSEGGGVVEPEAVAEPPQSARQVRAKSEVPPPQGRVARWLENFSEKWGSKHLISLVRKKGHLTKTMNAIPKNMHRVANQTRLVLELVDDFRDGTYREVSWRTIALLVGGLLYAVSPADVFPDTFPLVGQMDDLAVVALITRIVDRDLRKYCRFKGYPEAEYFHMEAA